jgi:hypothetical protein
MELAIVMMVLKSTVVAVLVVAAAASSAPIGLPGCNTTCGEVDVPYPFGIQPGCYRPGFNLTCDTSRHGSPRLLLGDGTLRVVDIFIQNATIRVLRDGSMVNDAGNITSDGQNVTFAPIFTGGHYRMSYPNNELVLFGCNVLATLVVRMVRPVGGGTYVFGGCASFCFEDFIRISTAGGDHYCSSNICCQASFSSVSADIMATELNLRPLESRNNSDDQSLSHVSVFLTEKGWLDRREWQKNQPQDHNEPKYDIPIILRWDILQGMAPSDFDSDLQECPRDVASLCKSIKSECSGLYDDEVYKCQCKQGYDGNPYVDGGCQGLLYYSLCPD